MNSPAASPIVVVSLTDLDRFLGETVRREMLAVAVQALSPTADQPPATPPSGPPKSLLSADEVAKMVTLSKRTIRRAILSGDFPPALSFGSRAIRWLRSDVELWLSQRKGAK